MNDIMQQAVADALTYLTALSAEGVCPPEALHRLRSVQARHAHLDMELVWEEEAYDHSVHYDLLVRPIDGATVSLSVCPDRALPWPLRGVRRWSDANLVQVNGRMLTMEDAVGFLDVLWNEAPIMDRMVNACLIREELARHPVELGDDELQAGMDGLRRAKKLYTAEAVEQWMQQRGLTHEQLERLVVGNLTCIELRKRVADGRVASYFEAHHAELDTAHVARLECPDEATARHLHATLAAGDQDFFAVAQQQFLAGRAEERALFATLRRRSGPVELTSAVFAATPGDILGPFRVGAAYLVVRLLSLSPARQDEPTRAAIEEALFDEWLIERRRAATVTWHWGTSNALTDAT